MLTQSWKKLNQIFFFLDTEEEINVYKSFVDASSQS